MSGRKKATAKPLLASSVKLVKPPYLSLVGPQISIHAGWWTAGCGEANESVGDLSLCQVLEVDEQREAQMGVKEVMFKVALVTSKDPHFTRAEMEENVDYWWVGRSKFSSAHYIFEKEETARKKRVLEEAGGDAEVEAVEDTKKPKKNAPSAVFVFWDLVTETVGGVEKASFECNLDKKYGKSPVKTYQKNGSFSYSGRAFSKLRRNMSVANLCAMVVGASYPFPLLDSEIMAEYETKREAIGTTAAASRSATAAAAGTAGPVAAAAATASPAAAAAGVNV